MKERVDILNHGFVALEYMAPEKDPELQIVNSARVSFGKHKKIMDESDEGLLNYLIQNKHGTPFEMVDFLFHVRVPIFVAREWHRHRIASYNEISARYTKLAMAFYTPEDKDLRKQQGKPGHYHMIPMQNLANIHTIQSTIREVYRHSENAYNTLLKYGLAKEMARIILPVGIYTEFYCKANLRSWMNFMSLRNSSHAMYEIRVYAQAIEEMIKERLPVTMKLFEDNKRVSP